MAETTDRRARPRVPTVVGQRYTVEEFDAMLAELEGLQRRLVREKSVLSEMLGELKESDSERVSR